MVIVDALTRREDGRKLYKQVGIDVPRQNGKGNIIAVLQLFGILYGGAKLVLYSCHEFDAANEHYLRLKGFVEDSPALSAKVRHMYDGNGFQSIVFHPVGDSKVEPRLKIKARKNGSGRAFSGDQVWFDEAMIVRPGVFQSMLPALSARKDPQVFYVGSAPVMGPESDDWRGVITEGRRGHNQSLYFAEWSAEFGADVNDVDLMHAVNPGMPITVQPDWCLEVERGRMSDDEWGRERFGMWNPDEATPRELPAADWDACADTLAAPGDPIMFGLEMSRDRMTASVGACGEWHGHNAVTVVDHRSGVSAASWLPARLFELQERHKARGVVVDDKSLPPDDPIRVAMDELGVTVVGVDTKQHIAACAGLFDEVLARTLRHPDLPVLSASAAAARKRDVAGSWLWKGDESLPLIAAGLARWGHLLAEEEAVDMASQVF